MKDQYKKQEIVYGTRVNAASAEQEIEKGRITVHQDLFKELDGVTIDEITCQIFAPKDILEMLGRELKLGRDPDCLIPCLNVPQKETWQVIEMIKTVIPELDLLNSDDDKVFSQRLVDKEKE